MTAAMVLLLVWCEIAGAQTGDMESVVRRLGQREAKAYVAPVARGYSVNSNGGWFHGAPRAAMLGFDLELGAVVMGTNRTDEDRTFALMTDYRFGGTQAQGIVSFVDTDPAFSSFTSLERDQIKSSVMAQITGQSWTVEVRGPTVIGSNADSIRVLFPQKTFPVTGVPGVSSVTVPARDVLLPATGLLKEMSMLVLAAPQLTIGTIAGSQLTFRYLPSRDVRDVGRVEYVGWGVQHNPGIWFGERNPLPIDLSASYFTQTFKIGTIETARSSAYGIMASKRFGGNLLSMTPYAGYFRESSSMEFSYMYDMQNPIPSRPPIPVHVAFTIEGEQQSRAIVGLSARFLILNFNADYSLGKYNSIAIGVMVAL